MRVFDNPLKKRFKRSFKLKTTLRLKLKFGDFRKKLYNSLELKNTIHCNFPNAQNTKELFSQNSILQKSTTKVLQLKLYVLIIAILSRS